MMEGQEKINSFEEAMNICEKQGKKLRTNMRFKQEGLQIDFSCEDKNTNE